MARRHQNAVRVTVAVMVLVPVAGCDDGASAPAPEEAPLVAEAIDGSDLQRLTLSEAAAERLDIRTSLVAAADEELMVPRAAVVIDPTGAYWVYTSPEPLVFVRQELRRVREEGQMAYYAEGPDPGTAVVTTGVPELYGAEFGIGK
jgi:hypothetical protein